MLSLIVIICLDVVVVFIVGVVFRNCWSLGNKRLPLRVKFDYLKYVIIEYMLVHL